MARAGERLTLRALSYRPGQAITLFVLSLVSIAACAFGPFYERAVETAQLHATLNHASVADRALSIRAGSGDQGLPGLLPSGSLAHYYNPMVETTELAATFTADQMPTHTRIVTRTDECQHLHFVSGSCPTQAGQVAASSTAATALHLGVGSRIRLTGVGAHGQPPTGPVDLTISGLYAPFDPSGDYWFGRSYASPAGVAVSLVGLSEVANADALFARQGFVADLSSRFPDGVMSSVLDSADLSLRSQDIGLDDITPLRQGLNSLITQDGGSGAIITTQLPYLLDDVQAARHQARSVIPAFAAELALLVLVVVGIVVVSAAEQRQQEFALARLRGRSAGRAARLFDREFGVLVLASVIPGLAAGWALCWLAAQWWLSGLAAPELRWPVLAAVLAVTAVELLIIGVVARRTARRPVHAMLRRVPQRSSRFGVSAVESAIGAAALGGVIVMASGSRSNALAVITPGLIALVAGLVLGRVAAAVAQRVGQRALWRGRMSVGLAGLQLARRPGLRRVVALLCVAAALIVSAADQWSVSARNRAARADVQVGAAVTLTVQAGDPNQLADAVHAADPSGRYATPVIVQNPPNAVSVMAIDPATFDRVAAWGWAKDRPPAQLFAQLKPKLAPAVTFTGTQVALHTVSSTLTRTVNPDFQSTAGPLYLGLDVFDKSGKETIVKVGPIPEGKSGPATLRAAVPCAGGCRLAQLQLLRTTTDSDIYDLQLVISRLEAGSPGQPSPPVNLGPASDWTRATPEVTGANGTETISLVNSGGALTLTAHNGGSPAAVQHDDVPVAIPTIVGGTVPPQTDQLGNLESDNLDGLIASFAKKSSIPLVPGPLGNSALLVDLRTASALMAGPLSGSTAYVWLSRDDPSREKALVAALDKHGITVLARDSAAAHRATLAASAPAWAMQLSLMTAALAVLIAAVVVLLTATTSQRSRSYDFAGLRLVGVSRRRLRRAALLEQLAAAVAGVVVGGIIGVVGAHMALPAIPMFLATAPVPPVLRPIAWGSVLVAALIALAALALTAALVGQLLMRRIAPARLREGSTQ